jgi:probable HAF family extracellular repeat protein
MIPPETTLRLFQVEAVNMKTLLISVTASSLLAAIAMAQPAPRYRITDLGTLGGTYSYAYGINNFGQVSGGAATKNQTGGLSQTAFLSYGGRTIDLGTLGGSQCPNCNSETAGTSASGVSAVISEISKADPNGEDFCAFGTHAQCLAASWKDGSMTALPTLGGNNAQAYWINNFGQVAGLAETGQRDPTCSTATPFQVLRFKPAIWGPNGELNQLPPLPGDTVGFAFGINDNGEAIGVSGLCGNTSVPPVTPFSLEPHAVLWERDGTPVNLGNLGGTFNVPGGINNRGDVAGGAQSSKDGNIHAFLWTRSAGMQDLGLFPGSVVTAVPCCNTINNSGQIALISADAMGNTRALLWQNGKMYDMNDLIPAGSPWNLQFTASINDAGEIVGWGLINGEVHAFLASPR